jgi:hypothetical protein
MRRKLLVLAGLLGICVFGMQVRPAAAFTFCNVGCDPDATCECPANTLNRGAIVDCPTWHADCNFL